MERRRSDVAVGGLPRLVSGDGARPSGDPHAEQMFGALLESAPDAMVAVGDAGTIRLVNAQTKALFGYPREELLGRKRSRADVVEALASAWGTWPSSAGKTVWFTLATDSPARISSRPPDGRPSR